MSDGRIKHGMGRRSGRPPEFNVWCKMRQRCNSPASHDYANYGGRGIKVCARWDGDFAAFLSDMGSRPSGQHSIERKDNNGDYEPGNCVWATRDVQANNRRPRRSSDTCSKGHSLAGDNLYERPDGKRGCRACRQQNMKDFYERKRASA